jgi:hypothetical protein
MSPRAPRDFSRRIVFVNPRFQGRVALCFAAVVFAGGALFVLLFLHYAKATLRVASLQGHYHFLSAYEIVGGVLIPHLAVLSTGVLAASLLVLLLLIRRVRRGVDRLVEAFLISTEGDLSTPTEAPGLSGITDLGGKIDSARSRTLSRIREIAAEAEFLRSEPLSEEEFAKRWNALKAAVRKVAP